MQIYDDSKKKSGTLTNFKDRKIVKTLDSGDKELTFKYPANGKQVGLLKVEHYIRTKEDEFVLRAVKTGSEFNEYTAQLNVEELETQAFPYGFESQEQDIRSCLEFAFEGTGWTVGECSITKKRTINFDKPATAWDVLQQCLSTYRVECKIDTINKRIDIYEQIGSDKGCYFVEGLNLRKLTVNSDTYDFYTRLIPLGKDGINIEWLTGKLYLENYQYSSKVKTIVWKDERYTNTTSLIEDGTAKLEEMSKPYRVFSANVVDLARQNKRYKNILDFDIGDTVLMISRRTKSREKQRIVKITMYPETPQKNTVELSNTTKTFAEVQQAELERSQTEAVDIATSSAKKILRDGYYTKEEVESHITASADAVSLGVSKIYETKAVVEEKIQGVNKRTDEKLTEYSTTEEMQAAIDLKADQINLSVSKTYATTSTVTEKFNSAVQKGQQAADAAEAAANKATDEKLTEYSTTEEMQAAIDLKADQINLSVSKTYATTTTVTEKFNSAVQKGQQAADAAEAAANKATDEKLTEYSTTEEMQAAIDLKADQINLSVSKTYATTSTVTEKFNSAVQKGQQAADAAEAAANKATDEKLTEYSTTEEMQAAIDLKADQINLSVSKTYATTTTVTEKFNSAVQKGQQAADAAEAAANKATDEKLTEYSTTEEMQAAIDLKADQINLSVSKTYATTSTVTEKFNSAVQKGQQAADAAEAAANANTTNRLKNYSTTTQMNAAIKAKADEITLEVNKKVDSSEFGTKISQNAYYVRVAWNGNSKYIQFENGGISMYDGAVETSKRRAIFNYSGEHFYRDGYYVGKIGTNQWSSNNAHKGLVFDLEAQGKYMTWARKKSASDDTYTTILCYSRANSIYDKEGLHLGCNLYGNNFDAYGLDLHDSSANGYSVTEGKRVPIITSIKSNADGTISWTYSSFTVRNGMITSVPDSSTSI